MANIFNVMSNAPFFIVGMLGLYRLYRAQDMVIINALQPTYGVFFLSLVLIALGSPYYHLQPDNFSLLWDRLPMSMAFMAFFCIVVGEFIDEKIAAKIFYPLVITGLVSVVYWYWTETRGEGDLRLYILVQYLPVVLIPFILWRGTSSFSHGHYYWAVLGCYVLAKLFELNDRSVFEGLGFISGHSIKHLVSALGAYVFYRALRQRRRALD